MNEIWMALALRLRGPAHATMHNFRVGTVMLASVGSAAQRHPAFPSDQHPASLPFRVALRSGLLAASSVFLLPLSASLPAVHLSAVPLRRPLQPLHLFAATLPCPTADDAHGNSPIAAHHVHRHRPHPPCQCTIVKRSCTTLIVRSLCAMQAGYLTNTLDSNGDGGRCRHRPSRRRAPMSSSDSTVNTPLSAHLCYTHLPRDVPHRLFSTHHHQRGVLGTMHTATTIYLWAKERGAAPPRRRHQHATQRSVVQGTAAHTQRGKHRVRVTEHANRTYGHHRHTSGERHTYGEAEIVVHGHRRQAARTAGSLEVCGSFTAVYQATRQRSDDPTATTAMHGRTRTWSNTGWTSSKGGHGPQNGQRAAHRCVVPTSGMGWAAERADDVREQTSGRTNRLRLTARGVVQGQHGAQSHAAQTARRAHTARRRRDDTTTAENTQGDAPTRTNTDSQRNDGGGILRCGLDASGSTRKARRGEHRAACRDVDDEQATSARIRRASDVQIALIVVHGHHRAQEPRSTDSAQAPGVYPLLPLGIMLTEANRQRSDDTVAAENDMRTPEQTARLTKRATVCSWGKSITLTAITPPFTQRRAAGSLGNTAKSPQQQHELADYDEQVQGDRLSPRHLAPAVWAAYGLKLRSDARRRGGIEIRVSDAMIGCEEEMDGLPGAARRRRGRNSSPASGLQSTCAAFVRHTDAFAEGRRDGAWHNETAVRTARWRGGEDGPSVPLTNEGDDNRREADARTASLLPRHNAPALADPVAQRHGAGVSRIISDCDRSCRCYGRRWALKLVGYLRREDDINTVHPLYAAWNVTACAAALCCSRRKDRRTTSPSTSGRAEEGSADQTVELGGRDGAGEERRAGEESRAG
ncbi:hypothetical protein BJ912DRAFT_1061071 [Pholiota molesta]|nr:hypothetical protein BJ912DRAFT_1061071 [Pholiota molesta]